MTGPRFEKRGANDAGAPEPRTVPLQETPLENLQHLCAAVVFDAIQGIAGERDDAEFQRAWVLGETDSLMSFEMCVETIAVGTCFSQSEGLVEDLTRRILEEPRATADAFGSHLRSLALEGIHRPRGTVEAPASEGDLAALIGEARPARPQAVHRPGRYA